jgi:hypothetical protein
MKAVVFHDSGAIRLDDVPESEVPGDDRALTAPAPGLWETR